jgi:hypothetical protein
VLYLVIPQLSLCGKTTDSAILAVAKLLLKHQSPDGQISFDKWLIVARSTLKWNDNCIRL